MVNRSFESVCNHQIANMKTNHGDARATSLAIGAAL